MEASKISGEVTELVNEVVAKNGFKNEVVNIQNVKTKGGSFLGDLYSVEILENDRKLNLFVKVAPIDSVRRGLVNMNSAYNNEIFSYTKLKDCFMKLQKKIDVPKEDEYRFAELFGYSSEEGSEAIILENLKLLGYETHDRMKPINMNYMLEAIKALAEFHALTIAAQKYEPDFFLKEIAPRGDSVFTFFNKKIQSEEEKQILDTVIQNILNTVKAEHRDCLKKWYYSKERENIIEMTYHTKRSVSVFCHGDYRTENIFVKYDENGVIDSVIPIDYQNVYFGLPTTDLMYLIFTATHTKLRREHLNDWIQHYYQQLRNSLEKFSIDLDAIYPKRVYEKDVEDSLPYGLYVAVTLLHMLITDPNDVEDLRVDDLMSKDNTNLLFGGKLYKERISGIVEDFVNSGYLIN